MLDANNCALQQREDEHASVPVFQLLLTLAKDASRRGLTIHAYFDLPSILITLYPLQKATCIEASHATFAVKLPFKGFDTRSSFETAI